MIVSNGDDLIPILNTIRRYEIAVGSQLNVEKCSKMETVKDASASQSHLWDLAPIVNSTTYWGITITNAGRINYIW